MINNIRIGKKLYDLSTPKVMGIINTTPDSFFTDSRSININDTLIKVKSMIEDGADIIDIGGYSSRPGADEVSLNKELKRVIPAIEAIRKDFPDVIISCDTFRGTVAEYALESGANIINDISGGEIDPTLFDVVAKYNCPYILMHSKGTPQTMQSLTQYDFLFKEMISYFSKKIELLIEKGITEIILDPGFGFAKTLDQNHQILHFLKDFNFLNKPLLVGVSRKSLIYKQLNINPEESLNGTTILNTKAIMNGASILRVHDVKEAKQIISLLY
jgi:dihydropteroate synthase